jgi:hypothetical protein
MTMNRRVALAASALVIAGTLTACAPSTLPVFIPNGTSLCSDSAGLRSGSVGVPLTNTSSTPITLTSAGPMAVSNAELLGSWIVPATDAAADDLVFSDEAVPVSKYVDWAGRVDPDGAVVDAGETVYVVIAIALLDGSDSGWIEGVQAMAGDSAKTAPDTGFGIAPGGNQCPWSPPGGMPEPSPTETGSP